MFNKVDAAKKVIEGIVGGFQKQIDKLDESVLIIEDAVASNTAKMRELMAANDKHVNDVDAAIKLRGKLWEILN